MSSTPRQMKLSLNNCKCMTTKDENSNRVFLVFTCRTVTTLVFGFTLCLWIYDTGRNHSFSRYYVNVLK